MPIHYWDTSALAKHYHSELGTPKVDQLLQAPGSRHIISRLAVAETFSVFAGKVRAGAITDVDFRQLCRRFLADARGPLFSVARLRAVHFRRAEALLRRYGPIPGQGLRTLDSLQLAVAVELRSQGPIDSFVSADARLLAAAQAEGFSTINPEQP
jgi:predicted nucleic acid-binding protein